MRYPPGHKQRIRQRIVREAARLFRRHGYEGVGIESIMAAAGLTRGGFYGHFRSKDSLFAAVLRGEHDFVERMRARPGRTRAALAREGLGVVAGYLAPENRARVGRGCALAALGVDTARSGRAAREAYGEAVRALAGEFARGLADPSPDDPRALASIALCVGGLVLGRAVGDGALADRIAASCRDAVADVIAAPPPSDSPKPREEEP